MTRCLEQCDCYVSGSKQERERYNTFKRTFRLANWYIAKKRGDRYYNTVRAAHKAQITGSTLDRFLKERDAPG